MRQLFSFSTVSVAFLLLTTGSLTFFANQDHVRSEETIVQTRPNPTQPNSTTPSNPQTTEFSDSAFLTKAAQGGMAEVQLGQLAQQKAANRQVKQFGQQMIRDHSKSNQQVMALLRQKGMTPPTSLQSPYKELHDRLSTLSGNDFDREYMSQMVIDHTDNVKDFQQAATSAQDPQIRAFAQQQLPTLQAHLQSAQTLENQLTSNRNP